MRKIHSVSLFSNALLRCIHELRNDLNKTAQLTGYSASGESIYRRSLVLNGKLRSPFQYLSSNGRRCNILNRRQYIDSGCQQCC